MDQSLWQKAVGADAHKKSVRSCNRNERGVHAKKRKGISIVKEGKKVCKRTTEKGIHIAIQVTANGTSVLHRQEGWKEENGSGL